MNGIFFSRQFSIFIYYVGMRETFDLYGQSCTTNTKRNNNNKKKKVFHFQCLLVNILIIRSTFGVLLYTFFIGIDIQGTL